MFVKTKVKIDLKYFMSKLITSYSTSIDEIKVPWKQKLANFAVFPFQIWSSEEPLVFFTTTNGFSSSTTGLKHRLLANIIS